MAAFKHGAGDDAGKWEVSGRIVCETDKAIWLDDGVMRAWLPKRFLKIERMLDNKVAVLMPQWLARKERYV